MKILLALLILFPALSSAEQLECKEITKSKVKNTYTVTLLKERYLVLLYQGVEYDLPREYRDEERSLQNSLYTFENLKVSGNETVGEILHVSLPQGMVVIESMPPFTGYLTKLTLLAGGKHQVQVIKAKCEFKTTAVKLSKKAP